MVASLGPGITQANKKR